MKTTSPHSSDITAHSALCLSLGLVFALLGATAAQGANYTLGATNCWEGPASGTDSVVLAVNPANGVWSATANAAWLHLSAANQNGTGSTNVVFTFDANTGATRSGTLTIGGQTLTVTQAGSTYVRAPGPLSTLVSSGIYQPHAVAVDGAGNVYIADAGNNAIKKWVAASNIVTTLVSSGLNQPYGVAVDGAGNVYIADTYNNAIKEWVAASGTVTNLVSSGLNQPYGVAVDGAGNVYIADTYNNAIKEWVVASNTVITNVSSGLSFPYSVAVDGAGNVYIADIGHTAIKEWVAASGTVITLVSSGLSAPWNVAVDGAGNVYIADYYNNAVKEWVAASSTVITLASSGLNGPLGVAVDGAGNIYISDYGYNQIKELPRAFVDPTARWERPAAGSDSLPVVLPATENLLAPFAPTSDQSWLTIAGVTNGVVSYAFTGNTDNSNRTAHITLLGQSIPITQFSLASYSSLGATNLLEGPGAGSDSVVLAMKTMFGDWTATANDTWLHLSAANQSGAGSTNVVFTFDANTGATRIGTLTIAGQTLTVTQAGSTYVAAPAPVTTLVSSGLISPIGVAVDSAGDVYFADNGNSVIKEWVAASNTVITNVSSGLSYPYGVAVDGAGNVYIADLGHSAIKEWVAASNTVITLVSSGLNLPTGVAVDGAGNVYIADYANGLIKKWVAASNTVVTLVSSSSGLGYPYGVAVDGAGNVYIADQQNNAIKEWVAASNTVVTLVSSGLNQPHGVAVDGAGNVHIADSSNNQIKELPRAFVDPTARWEGPDAGSDVLPVVLPATENLRSPFAPASDQPWLTIAGVTNGVVSYAFTGNTANSNRTAHVTLLGQSIPITQFSFANYASLGATNLLEGPGAGSDSVVLAVNMPNGPWTATANDIWLHLSAENQSGTGSTNVVFTFDVNPGATRSGTLTIAGQTLTVTQAGSTYVAAPAPVTALVSSGLNMAWGVAVDGVGNVYITDTYNNAIKKWVAASNTVITLVSSGLNVPTGVAVDGAGNVYIADLLNNAIKKWVAASNTVVTLVSSGLNQPYDVAVDGAGNVYIADYLNNAIKKWVAASNTVVTLVSSGLSGPWGVAVDGAGNVYIADTWNNQVKEWVAASHTVITLVSSGLNQPASVAVDGSGNVYIADLSHSAIKEWVAASHTVITNVASGLNQPSGVAVDSAGNVYIADLYNYAIKELPRAFVDPTARSEGAASGADSLPVVLPPTENLRDPFAPTSDQPWLTVTSVTNGVVGFSFTGTTSNRTAHITLLGQAIAINQAGLPAPPILISPVVLANGSFQFAFSNTVSGASFTILSTTNLDLPVVDWQVLATSNNCAAGLLQFTIPLTTSDAQRFYDLRSP